MLSSKTLALIFKGQLVFVIAEIEFVLGLQEPLAQRFRRDYAGRFLFFAAIDHPAIIANARLRRRLLVDVVAVNEYRLIDVVRPVFLPQIGGNLPILCG